MKNFLLSLAFLSAVSMGVHAQTAGYIFGIDNPSPTVFWFSKTEVATGTHTQLLQLPISFYTSASSSCSDMVQQLYFYTSGTEMYKLDPVNGTLLSITSLPLPANANLYHIQYNPCDSMIYGVVNDYPNSIYLGRYNPYTNTLSNAGALPLTMQFCMGCMATIDPVNQLYYMHDGTNIYAIDLVAGQFLYSTPVINMGTEIFGHISYDCASGKIIGTSAGTDDIYKFLASVDPVTGIVTHISGYSWPQGAMKPVGGGNCIDYTTGIYYYSGMPDLIIGVDVITGDTTSIQATGEGSFLFVQCFSMCPCAPSAVDEKSLSSFLVYPNPAENMLIVECTNGMQNGYFVITDALGREVMNVPLNDLRTVISLEQLAAGTYFWRTESSNAQGKFVRVTK